MARPDHPRWQVFTDDAIATHMAHLVMPDLATGMIRMLDAGAGAGALSEAFVRRTAGVGGPVTVTAVERDPLLSASIGGFDREGVKLEIVNDDFFNYILTAEGGFSHALINPPYGRPRIGSAERDNIRELRLPGHNLYAAFMWATFDLLADGARLVAIVPRSVLTGPLAGALRFHLLTAGVLEHVTLFQTRKLAFARDAVQQDVAIVCIQKTAKSPRDSYPVTLGRVQSVDPWVYEEDRTGATVVWIDERPSICTAPHDPDLNQSPPLLPSGVSIKTGPVVDFRMKAHISQNRTASSVPLIEGTRKDKTPRYFAKSAETARYIMPAGFYVAVDRFSPPERTPRVASRQVDARGTSGVAFENHVLVIHRDNGPLTSDECAQIHESLQTDAVSKQLDILSSSTHLNLSDLTRLRRFA